MKLDQFCEMLLSAAKASGIDTAEVYATSSASFRAGATNGSLDDYSVSSSSGLSLRGTVNGKMGYASTQAYDEEAVRQLVEGVLESASLNEADEQDEIYAGDDSYPELEQIPGDLDQITAQQKVDAVMQMDAAVRKVDPRITKVQRAMISTTEGSAMLCNSYGLKLQSSKGYAVAYCAPVATEGTHTTTGFAVKGTTLFHEIDPADIAQKAARNALEQLNGEAVASGTYRIVLDHDPMSDLLQCFCGMFSAENAQQKLSLLQGREGTQIAAECVTLMDDPLLPGGLASSPFDAEGSASRTKAVIDKGILMTLLHDRKTARKQGVTTTGNAIRAGYAGTVHVGPTNLFMKAGSVSRDELMAQVGNGLLITEVSGLHAGANPISGDFSLLSKGFLIEDGKKAHPVEQITVAGNFYELLKNIRMVANDLDLSISSVAAPSVDAGEMTVSGK